jgi:hypothetical protein
MSAALNRIGSPSGNLAGLSRATFEASENALNSAEGLPTSEESLPDW